MALDGITLGFIKNEISEYLLGAKGGKGLSAVEMRACISYAYPQRCIQALYVGTGDFSEDTHNLANA